MEYVATCVSLPCRSPSITLHLPDASKANGVAIVIAPGGGHRVLCVDHEGHHLARWRADRGVAASLLKYRQCREKDSTDLLKDHPAADMQRAIRAVRHHAHEWHIEPACVLTAALVFCF